MKKNKYNKKLVFIIVLMLMSIVFFPITMTRNKTVTALSDDTTPPFLQITKPTNALYIQNNAIFKTQKPIILDMINIEVNAIDNESGINRVGFYIDETYLGDDRALPYSYFWEDAFSGFGEQTIKVIAYDNAGNSASTEIQVITWRYPILFLIPIIPLIILFILWNFPP